MLFMFSNDFSKQYNNNQFSLICAYLALIAGFTGVFGWILNNNALKAFLSDGASMKINTALLIISGSIGLAYINKGFVAIARLLFSAMAALSLAIIIEHLFNVNLHIDELWVKDIATDPRLEAPGRTSLLAALNSLLIAASLLMLSYGRYRLSQLVACFVFIIVYISFIGHLFHISGFYRLGRFSGIAFHTALALLLLATGALLIQARQGWVAVVYQRLATKNLRVFFLSYFLGAAPLLAGLYLLIVNIAGLPLSAELMLLIALTALLSLPVAYFLLRLVNRLGNELNRTDARLQIALDAAKLGAYDRDLETGIMNCTDQCKRNFGLPPTAVFNFSDLLNSIVPEYRSKMQEKVIEAIEQHTFYNYEYQVRWPDGSLHWIQASGKPLYNAEGKAVAITGVTYDNTAQVLAKQTLERALEQARLSKEAAELGTFDMDLEKGVMEWDERCRLLFGIKHQDRVSYETDFINGLHPDDCGRVTQLINGLMNSAHNNGDYDVQYRTMGVEDGQIRWVRAKGKVLFANNGSPYRFIGSVLDITDAVNHEQELQQINEELATANEELAASNEEMTATNEELVSTNEELMEAQENLELLIDKLAASERRFRQLVQYAPVAINVLKGREMVIESVNEQMLKIIGKEFGNLVGLPYQEAIPQLESQYFLKQLDQVYTSGDTYYGNEEKSTILNNGRLVEGYFNYIYQPIKDEAGVTYGIMIVATEVTELVKARNEREQAEAKLRLAIEAAGIGTWHIDPETKALRYNSTLAELFGYEGTELMTYEQAIRQVTEEHRESIVKEIERAIVDSGDYDITYTQRRFNDGEIVWLRSLGKITTDEQGNFNVFSGVVMDVTEQKRDELRKNDFIGMVSHELKTPLTSLQALLQVSRLKIEKTDDTFLKGAIVKANIQVKKMSSMITGFLNIARLESGKIQIIKNEFNLNELVVEVIDETRMISSSHEIRFIPNESLYVLADREKISSVISNLLSNAIKYSSKGKNIEVRCEIAGNTAQVSVKDEGMGIRLEDQAKLFERYVRITSNHTQHISGFGIGLYLCAEIIERHGGKIWVESEIGTGSIFYFNLPIIE